MNNDLELIREGLINLIQKGDKLLIKLQNTHDEYTTYIKLTVKQVDKDEIYFEEPYSIRKEHIYLSDNMLEGNRQYLIKKYPFGTSITTGVSVNTGTITVNNPNVVWTNNLSTTITVSNNSKILKI